MGPHSDEQAVNHIQNYVPDQGVKLTLKHFAYLKISEGCNHRGLSAFLSKFVTSRLPITEIILGLDQRIKTY